MKPVVAEAIRFYFEEANDAELVQRCRAPLEVAEVVRATAAEFAHEVEPEGEPPSPVYRLWASFGTYGRLAMTEFDTEIFVSKLARLFHVRHGFSVENHHQERMTPTLDGYGSTGYIKAQFRLHEALSKRLGDLGYTELDPAEMDEVIPSLSLPATASGTQINVAQALFQDIRGLCPAA